MALQTHAGLPAGPLIVRPGEMPDAHSPAFRHPHVLNYAPVSHGTIRLLPFRARFIALSHLALSDRRPSPLSLSLSLSLSLAALLCFGR
jgi:hypothetical protein